MRAKVEGQDRTIIGKRCLVFDYAEKKIVTQSMLTKNETRNEFGKNKEAYFRLRQHRGSEKKIKTYEIWLFVNLWVRSKGIGKRGEVKNERYQLFIPIADFPKVRFRSYGSARAVNFVA